MEPYSRGYSEVRNNPFPDGEYDLSLWAHYAEDGRIDLYVGSGESFIAVAMCDTHARNLAAQLQLAADHSDLYLFGRLSSESDFNEP